MIKHLQLYTWQPKFKCFYISYLFLEVIYYWATYRTFRPQLQKFSLKKIRIFFPKKICSEKVSYIFSKKAFLISRKWYFSYISGKEYSEPWHNRTFLIFRERNIQNPGITEFSYIFGNGTF